MRMQKTLDAPMRDELSDECLSRKPRFRLDLLQGEWLFERDIAPLAAMQGRATFTESENGNLQYFEEGEVQLLRGGEHRAHRHWLYTPSDTGFFVWFAEEPRRLFHHIELTQAPRGGWGGSAVHLCGDDRYASRYRFDSAGNLFRVDHAVQGPHKSYTSTTTYRRKP